MLHVWCGLVVRTLINDQIEKCLCAQQMVNKPRRTLPSELQRSLAASSPHPLPRSASLPWRVLAVTRAVSGWAWGAALSGSRPPIFPRECEQKDRWVTESGCRVTSFLFLFFFFFQFLILELYGDHSGKGWPLRSRLSFLSTWAQECCWYRGRKRQIWQRK